MDARPIKNAQLAREIGVSHVSISNFLAGEGVKLEHAVSLANFFGVPVDYLVCDPMKLNTDFARMFKASGWTVSECAQRLKLPPDEIEAYLSGERPMSVGVLRFMKTICQDSAPFPEPPLPPLTTFSAAMERLNLRLLTLEQLIELDRSRELFIGPERGCPSLGQPSKNELEGTLGHDVTTSRSDTNPALNEGGTAAVVDLEKAVPVTYPKKKKTDKEKG